MGLFKPDPPKPPALPPEIPKETDPAIAAAAGANYQASQLRKGQAATRLVPNRTLLSGAATSSPLPGSRPTLG